MRDLREGIANGTREYARAFLDGFDQPIQLMVARCVDYSALLRGEHEAPSDISDLLSWATERGRVILSARGASGKSALLHRAAAQAADLGFAPFFINLSLWDQDATAEWPSVSENPREAIDFLMQRFGASEYDITDAEFLPASVQKLFLIDGLNETPGTTADSILDACDQIAALMVGASVIITDRLVRRGLASEERWRFAMPLPVEQQEIDRLVAGQDVPPGAEALLPSPFFLDRALKGELRASPLGTIRELVEDRGKLDDQALVAASQIAFRAYEIDRSRTFARERFAETGRLDVLETLLAGGILIRVDETRIAFFHHWYHDYLASKYVADLPELWNFENRHRVLDILTFKANSFDTIGFALELLAADRSGPFLQAVYDWNPYAAGYALAEANVDKGDVPRDVRLIILAMLAEKRFDRHFHSARKAADALELLKDADARQLSAASSLADIFGMVLAVEPPSELFSRWRDLFTADGEAPADLVSALVEEDSIIGWTAANVLKRLALGASEVGDVTKAAAHERPVVRWRAVHVMGGFVIDEFTAALFRRLDSDEDENVQYGAIRSLVEIASRDETVTAGIVDGIIERLEAIVAKPRVLGELKRAVFLSEGIAPPGWATEMSRIFYHLLDRASDAADAEQWSKVASQLRLRHRADQKVAA